MFAGSLAMAEVEDELLELEDDGEAVDFEDYDLEEEEGDVEEPAAQQAGARKGSAEVLLWLWLS